MRWTSVVIIGVALFFVGLPVAFAQAGGEDPPYECDNLFGQCGTPEQSGGGGCGGGGSILVNNTDLGDTYQFADDFDDDGLEDTYDNCPRLTNPDQADSDGDKVGDACDNCLNASNADQLDIDGDSFGDLCDDDMDGDEIPDLNDNCVRVPNPVLAGAATQADLDGDGAGDACDDDIDGDGMSNLEDACPMNESIDTPTAAQEDECFPDVDGDGTRDMFDVCPTTYDPDQANSDAAIEAENGEMPLGDACDPDVDGDGFGNARDNCPGTFNGNQGDGDRDRKGDACDPEFCYVVLGDEANCLNPEAVLDVYSPNITMETGQDARLRLFANRAHQPMRYTWEVISAPAGSAATVANAKGAVTYSTPFEYHYLIDATPTFTPDVAGTYQVNIVVETIFEDQVTSMLKETASYALTVTVTGETVDVQGDEGSGGCQMIETRKSTTEVPMVLVILGALGLVVARRRRV